LLAVAKARLAHAPRVYTETAIEQNKGLIELCDKGISSKAENAAEKSDLEAAARTAATALRDFQSFLENDLLPRSDGDFRAGRETLKSLLRFKLDDDVDIDELARHARELLTRTKEEMVDTAMELAPSLLKRKVERPQTPAAKKDLIRSVLDALAADRPDNKT